MKAWIMKMLATIGDLMTSKKAIAAVGTVVSQVLLADPAVRQGVLVTGVAYVIGQAAADFGKNAKVASPPAS